jgi:hypothetical protein
MTALGAPADVDLDAGGILLPWARIVRGEWRRVGAEWEQLMSSEISDSNEPLVVPPIRLHATGYGGSTSVRGRIAIGPCENVDAELVQLLARMAQCLYACAGAMRTVTGTSENASKALLELLTASTAIAATEAETAASLFSFDLSATARIHVRALGDLARRFLLLPTHKETARRMFDASEASRLQLFRAAPEKHPARVAVEAAFDGDATTMEQLERRAYDEDNQSTPIFMSAFERRYLSKWNHADIIALVEAGRRLLSASDDVRDKLVTDDIADFTIYRACIFALGILHAAKIKYGVGVDQLDELTQAINSRKAQFDA